MSILLQILVLILSLGMFFVKRDKKICLFAIACICFSGVRSPFLPNLISPVMLFFLSELKYIRKDIREIKSNHPLAIAFLILTLGFVITYLTSPHLQGLKGVWTLFYYDFISKYAILFLVFCSIRNPQSFKPFVRVSFYCLCFLTIFGVINLITHNPIWSDWTSNAVSTDVSSNIVGLTDSSGDRFRVRSMFQNPFDYGFTCVMLLMLFVFARRKQIIKKFQYYISIVFTLFGIVTCNCRTVLAVLIIGMMLWILSSYNLKNQIRVVLVGSMTLIILVLTVPAVADRLTFLSTAFDDNSTAVSGSSLDMRSLQFGTVMYYIRNNLAFGRGYGFFNIDMGWGQGSDAVVDWDLFGIEGVYLGLLLERGIVGLIIYLIFLLMLVRFCFHEKKITKDKVSFAFCISVLACYITFAFMTGELISVPIVMLMLGSVSKFAELRES